MTDPRFDLIREWAEKRGLYEGGDPATQLVKLVEEQGELARALLKDKPEDAIDAIGDIVVVLTNLAALISKKYEGNTTSITLESCLYYAYQEIKDRTGSMKNGTFVKD